MANDCVSDNFDQVDTTLKFGRPVSQVLLDNTVTSTIDGKFSGTHAGTVYLSQDVTYTNGTLMDLRVTPIMLRPHRKIITTPPQTVVFQEWWEVTSGVAPGVPVVTFQTAFGGGSPTSSLFSQWLFGSSPASYAPFGQFLVLPGEGVRVKYECRLYTANGSGSSQKYAYANHHRIVMLGAIVRDAAVV